jgi:thiosulfate/3-mercaptopyruvate sulfurtransferase
LERDLSAPLTGSNGRHPLPPPEILAAVFSRWGIGPDTQVVAYDDAGGSFAGRLWWSLRYLGHTAVALLDGGLQAWLHAGHPLRAGAEERRPCEFRASVQPGKYVQTKEVLASLDGPEVRLLDARAPERFRGDEEPIDAVAGHIPGATNLPWQGNLGPDGLFLPPQALRRRFEAALGGASPDRAIVYCGSGATSCHLLVAMAHAGLQPARLYTGSWSEWCSDLSRPVARGDT